MRLREATWRDLAAMARLEQRCFPHDPWSEGSFWSELAQRPRRSYWVVEEASDGGELAGYAGLDMAGDLADVMTVAVDPRWRGRGLGARLLETMHARAQEAGAGAVLLEVRADNHPARSLYSERGYQVVRTRPGYYPTGGDRPPVDALVMRKELLVR